MNTHNQTRLTRRGLLVGLMLLPAAGMAHEGHGASRIKAEAKVLAIKGQTMSLRIELVNLGSNSVQLQGLGTELAQDVLLANPVSVPGYDAASLKVDLQFTKAIPGVFTIYLDFGEHGRGPVVVMP